MEGQSSYTSTPEQKRVYLQERSLVLAESDKVEHVFIDFRNKIYIDISMDYVNQINVSQDRVDGELYKVQ